MSTPPLWHEAAEREVLGALLWDEAAALRAAALLTASDFFADRHRVLFAAILALAQRGVTVNPVSLRDELLRDGQLERAGDLSYLADLIDETYTSAHLEPHAAIVRDYAIRRQLVADAHQAVTMAEDLTQPIGPTVAGIVDRLVRVAEPTSEAPRVTVQAELNAVLDEVERQAKQGDAVAGVSSGIQALDVITDGWVPGRLIVIAARPKCGKTALALHCAREACRSDTRTYFATAEQPRRELLKRLVAIEARVNLRAITTERDLARDAQGIATAVSAVQRWPLHIDQASLTPAAVRLGVQRDQAEHGRVELVVADYLGKFNSGTKSERHDLEIGKMTGAFARMAIDLDVPVLLLVQLNRDSVKGGQVRRPTVSDLRDSGSIEQDAAQVLFLYRDEKADEAAKDPRWLEVILELNRFGPTGSVDVLFERATGRWLRPLELAG